MDYDVEQKMNRLLNEEASLRIFWDEPPQTMLMPFMKSREEFFASVTVLVVPSTVNLETLAFIIFEAVTLLDRSGLLEGLRGVEVVPFVREGKNSVRLMRFSVRAEALTKVNTLLPTDLLKQNPSDGITCGWYVPKTLTPP